MLYVSPALLLNPYGYELVLDIIRDYIFGTAGLKIIFANANAYTPTYAINTAPNYPIDYLLMAMASYVFLLWQPLRTRQIDWVVILAFFAYSLLFLQFARATYPLAPVFVFASIDLLASKTNSWAWPCTQTAKLLITAVCLLCIGIIGWRSVTAAVCIGNICSDSITITYPVEEANYIQRLPTVRRIGNTDPDGGYLLYQLWPDKLVMIDTRGFPFQSWYAQYLPFDRGQEVQKFIDGHKAEVWLIPHDHIALMQWFLSQPQAWTPMFFGPAGIVFGSKQGQLVS